MKIRIDRAALADAVTWVSLAVPKKHTSPALAGIRLTAAGESLTLQAFDYEISHTATLPCEVLTEGEVLVSAALTRQIVASLKGKQVELVVDGNRLAIAAGRSAYRVGTMRLADYPSLPAAPAAVGSIEASDLAEIVGLAEFAASRDLNLPTLCSIHLAGDGEAISAAATDRFRIAFGQVPGDSQFEANVPAAKVGPALKGMRGEVQIGVEGGLFGLSDGSRSVTLRTVDVQFPDISRYVGMALPATYEVDAEELAAASTRAALVAEDFAPIAVEFGEAEVAISSDSESGDAAEYITCAGPAGDPVRVLFSARFLADALNALGSGLAEIGVGKPTHPITVRPVGSDRTTQIVMPRKGLS